jgi:hypothetical protein
VPGPLPDVRQEEFAQLLAKGVGYQDAYVQAGFVRNKGNAYRLRQQEYVRLRVGELQAHGMDDAPDLVRFRALGLFVRLETLIDGARKAGEYKVAIEGIKIMMQAAGYLDSPTLTHEHMGAPLPTKKDSEGNEIPFISDKTVGLMKSFQALHEAASAAGQAKKAVLTVVPSATGTDGQK